MTADTYVLVFGVWRRKGLGQAMCTCTEGNGRSSNAEEMLEYDYLEPDAMCMR